MAAFISICIPAYKRTDFLKRLLDSISEQDFKDFEVVVTDDSPGNEAELLCNRYSGKFKLVYFKNPQPLGTPENWNQAVGRATGEWIKLMHDDDWFSDAGSLSAFANAARLNPGFSFFYSAYQNVYEEDDRLEAIFINKFRRKKLEKDALNLFSSNVIGPPSVTLVKNDRREVYDKNLKWLVDIDFYISRLKNAKAFYIDKPLVNVGINKHQVTQSTFRVAEVEVPEWFHVLNKIGAKSLRGMLVYDAWWRFLRNLRIRSVDDIRKAGYNGDVHPLLLSMIRWQHFFPRPLMQTGVFSKLTMFMHRLTHQSFLK
jgi:glycosyltransferase involved in cell wall biosynthesis